MEQLSQHSCQRRLRCVLALERKLALEGLRDGAAQLIRFFERNRLACFDQKPHELHLVVIYQLTEPLPARHDHGNLSSTNGLNHAARAGVADHELRILDHSFEFVAAEEPMLDQPLALARRTAGLGHDRLWKSRGYRVHRIQ